MPDAYPPDALERLRYPIGRFERPAEPAPEAVAAWIDAIAELPSDLRAAVDGLADGQLDTPYRTDGWTIRQVVHHVADSHTNAYVRTRWALTETEPTIKAYDEKAWAELPDARWASPAVSLDLLDALHARWVRLLRALGPDDLARVWHHPESGRWTVAQLAALYAWHGRHHLAHVTTLREREGW